VWTAESLPVERRTAGELFALTAFNTGLYGTGMVARTGPSWTELRFRVGPSDLPFFGTNQVQRGDWAVTKVKLSDPTGNFISDRTLLGRIVWQTATGLMARSDKGIVNNVELHLDQ
jgi:hypothetical protein